jgi:hypothetical protein
LLLQLYDFDFFFQCEEAEFDELHLGIFVVLIFFSIGFFHVLAPSESAKEKESRLQAARDLIDDSDDDDYDDDSATYYGYDSDWDFDDYRPCGPACDEFCSPSVHLQSESHESEDDHKTEDDYDLEAMEGLELLFREDSSIASTDQGILPANEPVANFLPVFVFSCVMCMFDFFI